MSIPKLTIATRLATIIAVICVGLSGYLIGSYGLIKSDHTAEILDAVHVDIRPAPIDAAELEQRVNAERTKLGMVALTHSDLLSDSACMKLDDMVTNNYWAHVSPTGIQPWHWFQEAGYRYLTAGENLAYGTYTAKSMVLAWMNSKTHKENILGNYTQQGICSKVVKYMGTYTVLAVNHFGTPY